MLTTVVFDVGETLVDETSLWAVWCERLGVPPFALHGVLGGLAALGRDHREFVSILRPDSDFATEVAALDADGVRWHVTADDLYPDVRDCLEQLRADGWQVVVGGNNPRSAVELRDECGLEIDVVTSSAELGLTKPDPAFFAAVAAAAGARPEECVSVGDRVDNDVVPALAAGMRAVHLVRGPWGYLHQDDGAVREQVRSLAELPELLRGMRDAVSARAGP